MNDNPQIPDDAKFIGYVIYLPKEDEFIGYIEYNEDMTNAYYVSRPEFAALYINKELALKDASHSKYETAICLLLETDSGFFLTS